MEIRIEKLIYLKFMVGVNIMTNRDLIGTSLLLWLIARWIICSIQENGLLIETEKTGVI